jgi:hypothetical protein
MNISTPYLIAKQTNFDVELRRWHSRSRAIMGPMTEVYILRKPGGQGPVASLSFPPDLSVPLLTSHE